MGLSGEPPRRQVICVVPIGIFLCPHPPTAASHVGARVPAGADALRAAGCQPFLPRGGPSPRPVPQVNRRRGASSHFEVGAMDGRSCLFSRARAIEEEDVEAPSPTAPCVVWGGRVEQSSGDCSPVVVVALWRGEDGLCECPQPEWASGAHSVCKSAVLLSLVGATTAGRRHKGWEGVGAAWRGGRIGQPLTRPATPAQPRLCIPGE